MKKPLRILLLEDQVSDAELLIREIQRAGFTPECRRVETEADFLAGLPESPDLVISDYSLPHFDGLRAVKLLRERGLDTPFILVSGVLGEAAAVEAMKLGVDDYLLKDRMVRIGPAIEHVLEKKRLRDEHKEDEARLRLSGERTGRLVRAASVGLWEWNLLTDAVYYSPEWKRQLGYADDEIANRFDEWQKRVHPEDLARSLAAVSDFIDGRRLLYAVELRLLHRDGSWRWVYGEADLERNEKGEPVMMMGSQIDITESKRSNEERSRLAGLLEQSLNEIYTFSTETLCFEYANASALRNLGYGLDQILTMTPVDLNPEFDAASFRAMLGPLLRQEKEMLVFQTVHRRANGTLYAVEVHVQLSGSPDHQIFLAMILDISERRAAELRTATHDQTMTALASCAPLAEVLTILVRGVEAEHPGTFGSVLLLDAAGTHLLTGSAPSLPAFYNGAIHGLAIGTAVGSCGTAAFMNERVLVADIQTDPLWTDYKELAAEAGLASCWSEPIRGTRGQVVGTFAFYHGQPRLPSEAETGSIVAAAKLAAVAIERTRAEEEIQNQLHELQRWQEAMLGRENRVSELKREVNELLLRQNQPPRYSHPDAP